MATKISQYLQTTIEQGASDLHLIANIPPTLRVQGKLVPLGSEGVLTHELIYEMLKEVLLTDQLEKLTVNKELDFSLAYSSAARFRVNAYTQKATLAAAFRIIPLEIPAIDSLGLPGEMHTLTTLRQGLVIVAGPTGHGKSTSLAAMINEINTTRDTHIVTIEDPIEFIFRPAKSIISQREMNKDTHSWPLALRSVLREDPDVVLVGEMRDHETMAATLTVAETGHLVFATLHTNSAAQTIDRIVDVFPEEQQGQIRLQLSNSLEAVVSQRLIPDVSGKRTIAYELMFATTAIKTAIREGKTHQIDSIIQVSAEAGMRTLDSVLAGMVKAGKIAVETAYQYSNRPDELKRMIQR